jgi:hypothetical protein
MYIKKKIFKYLTTKNFIHYTFDFLYCSKQMINNFLIPGKCFCTNYKTLWITVRMKMQFYAKYFYSFLKSHQQNKITKILTKQQQGKNLKF